MPRLRSVGTAWMPRHGEEPCAVVAADESLDQRFIWRRYCSGVNYSLFAGIDMTPISICGEAPLLVAAIWQRSLWGLATFCGISVSPRLCRGPTPAKAGANGNTDAHRHKLWPHLAFAPRKRVVTKPHRSATKSHSTDSGAVRYTPLSPRRVAVRFHQRSRRRLRVR
jgi:hypothetical protein